MNTNQGLICEPLKGVAQVSNAMIWTEEGDRFKEEITQTVLEVANVSSEIDRFEGLVIKVLTKVKGEPSEEDPEPEDKIIKQCLAIDQSIILEILKMKGKKPIL